MSKTLLRVACYAVLGPGLWAAGSAVPAQNRDPWVEMRARLVEYEVAAAGVRDARVIDAIRTGDQSKILSSYLDGVKTLDITLAANESAERGGEVVKTRLGGK